MRCGLHLRACSGSARGTAATLGLLLWVGVIALGAEGTATEVRSFQELWAMPQSEVARGWPVRVQGVVTYVDGDWNMLYLHDGQQGFFLNPAGLGVHLRFGDAVELRGTTGLQGETVAILQQSVTRLGPGRLPEPKRLAIKDLHEAGSGWVECEGSLRWISTNGNHLQFYLSDGSLPLMATVAPGRRRLPLPSIDSKLRIRGVNASELRDGRVVSGILFVPGLTNITVLERASTKLEDIEVSAARLLQDSANRLNTSKRVRIRGTVTSSQKDALIVRDVTGSTRVLTPQAADLPEGTQVDVWGFPRLIGGVLNLVDAFCRVNEASASTGEAGSPPTAAGIAEVVPTNTPLTTVAAMRALRREEVARGAPVQLSGVITYADPEWGVHFFQDETSGTFFSYRQPGLKPGDWVELAGVTEPSRYAPVVGGPAVRQLGQKPLPAPVKAYLDDMTSGELDSLWVEVEGRVRSLVNNWGHVYFEIVTRRGSFKALVPGLRDTPMPTHLVDAQVRLRGVCTAELDGNNRLIGIIVQVPGLDHVEVLQAALTNRFELPTTPIASVSTYGAAPGGQRQVKVHGVVTAVASADVFYVQDTTGGIRVNARHTELVTPGQELEVVGYPSPGVVSPALQEAVFQVRGRQPLPAPVAVRAEDILGNGTNNATRVRMEARLVKTVDLTLQSRLLMQDGPTFFWAVLPVGSGKAPSPLPAGTILQLTGVCSVQGGQWQEPRSLQLLLGSPADLVILQTPSGLVLRHVLLLLGGVGAIAGLALAWAVTLRRRVRQQTGIIRQRLEAEAALEARYRELFENATDILLTFDREGRCTSANRAAVSFFGRDSADMLHLQLADLVSPADLDRVREHVRALLAGQPPGPLEIRARRHDGSEAILETNDRVIHHNGQAVGLQFAARDVTERHHLQAQLQHAHKMESVGQLAAGVAHEFNNLLTVIQGHASLVNLDPHLSPDAKDAVKEITESSRRAASLTRHLLTFSRKQPLHRRAVDLNAVLANVTDMLARLLGEQVQLEVHAAPDLPAILADTSMLEQILVNLTMNARNAMPDGGKLTLRTSRVLLTPEQAQGSLDTRPGWHVRLEVQDTGHGIEPSVLPRIFEPFYTTKDVGQGTGLGLATVYAIVRQHQGWIQVDSAVGRGTTFQIAFPETDQRPESASAATPDLPPRASRTGAHVRTAPGLHPPPASRASAAVGRSAAVSVAGPASQLASALEVAPTVAQATPVEPATSPVPVSGGETILVVEDEAQLRRIVQRVLAHQGYRVLLAESGVCALRLWDQHRDEITLLLTDMVMPEGMTGRQLADRLLAEKPTLKVIYSSGYSVDLAESEERFQEGMNFLPKPYTPSTLTQFVKSTLRQAV